MVMKISPNSKNYDIEIELKITNKHNYLKMNEIKVPNSIYEVLNGK